MLPKHDSTSEELLVPQAIPNQFNLMGDLNFTFEIMPIVQYTHSLK